MAPLPAKREADPSPDIVELTAAGIALLVVDEQGNVLRSSGWREILGDDAPARLPQAGAEGEGLLETMSAAAQDARRRGAAVRRYVGVSLEKRRFYAVFAGPLSASGPHPSVAVMTVEISDAFQAGPQEGDSIRQLGHDLRTPLTSMSGAVEILQMGRLGALSPEQAKLVGMLQHGIELMLSLIEQATTPYRDAALRHAGAALPPGDGILR